MDRMSPMLRAEVAGCVQGKACRSVWYLKTCSDKFVAQIAQARKEHEQQTNRSTCDRGAFCQPGIEDLRLRTG